MSQSEVSIVHLVTGADIVGKVHYNDAGTLTITDPVTPMIVPTPDGRGATVQLAPGRMFVKEGAPLEINRDLVVYVAPAAEPMEKSYRELTSNIVIAPASSLSTLLKS